MYLGSMSRVMQFVLGILIIYGIARIFGVNYAVFDSSARYMILLYLLRHIARYIYAFYVFFFLSSSFPSSGGFIYG